MGGGAFLDASFMGLSSQSARSLNKYLRNMSPDVVCSFKVAKQISLKPIRCHLITRRKEIGSRIFPKDVEGDVSQSRTAYFVIL